MEDARSHVLLAKVYSKMERPGDAITSLQQVNATACEWLCVSGCVVGGGNRRQYATCKRKTIYFGSTATENKPK